MDLSIVIVNYNTAELTNKAISSIVETHPKVKYEIIVIDNASSRGFKTTRKVNLIENNENLGFAKANNQGIEVAKGEYILLLNSDTIAKKGAIDALYNFAKENKEAGVVGARLLNTDGSIQSSVFRFPTVTRAIRQYFLGEKSLLDKYAPQGIIPVEVDAVVGAAFLITPSALAKLKKLNEKYFMYFEDLDYCRSVKRVGLKVYYLPSAEIVHIHGASGGKTSYLVKASKVYHGVIGHYILNTVLWIGQKWQKFLKTLN
jgi:GT2 family glycosyltransferase